MHKFSINLYDDTVEWIDEAAMRCGLPRAAFIRKHLQEYFDGTPQNIFGGRGSSPFLDQIAEAIGIILASRVEMNKDTKGLAKRRAEEVRFNMEWPSKY